MMFLRLFLRLDPVTVLTLCFIVVRRAFEAILLLFSICEIKLKKFLIKIVLTWVVPETVSTKYLWVFLGRLYMVLKKTFQEFSTITDSLQKRSQRDDPEK